MTKDYMEVLADAKAAEDEAAKHMIAVRKAYLAILDNVPIPYVSDSSWRDKCNVASDIYHDAKDAFDVAHKAYLAAEKVWLKKVRG